MDNITVYRTVNKRLGEIRFLGGVGDFHRIVGQEKGDRARPPVLRDPA